MSSKKKQQIAKEEKDWESINDAVVTSERFIEKYQKQILICVVAVLAVICVVWAYKALYMKPKTLEAQVAMFKGEQYFDTQQDSLALYGDGNGFVGFESIVEDYGSTKAGDLAKYYAGISNFRLGKYDQAISYLKDFKGGDETITYLAKGTIGDCLANTGKIEESVKYFVDAAKEADNQLISPVYYKKAIVAYRELKNYDKVIELGNIVKTQYMNTPEAGEVGKYIEEAQLLKGSK